MQPREVRHRYQTHQPINPPTPPQMLLLLLVSKLAHFPPLNQARSTYTQTLVDTTSTTAMTIQLISTQIYPRLTTLFTYIQITLDDHVNIYLLFNISLYRPIYDCLFACMNYLSWRSSVMELARIVRVRSVCINIVWVQFPASPLNNHFYDNLTSHTCTSMCADYQMPTNFATRLVCGGVI